MNHRRVISPKWNDPKTHEGQGRRIATLDDTNTRDNSFQMLHKNRKRNSNKSSKRYFKWVLIVVLSILLFRVVNRSIHQVPMPSWSRNDIRKNDQHGNGAINGNDYGVINASHIIPKTTIMDSMNDVLVLRDPMQVYAQILQKPLHSIQIRIKPSLGRHTYTQDAIFAIAPTDEYETYVLFFTTLRKSGFQGDVVLAVPKISTLSERLFKFLKYYSTHDGLVIYDDLIRSETDDGQVLFQGDSDTFANETLVYLKGLYDDDPTPRDKSHVRPPLEDMRPPRTLGIAKTEMYWLWSKQYSPASHILLMDTINDTYFQQGAEIGIGLGRVCTNTTTELHLYEEKHQKNPRVIYAPTSIRNGNIIHNTYGKNNILSPLSVHGHQQSIEVYLRAMIQRFDDTHCVKYQCEWAFHNHLYYSGILKSLTDIGIVHVHLQGSFAVNSVGLDVPLRSSTLVREANETFTIFNRPMGGGIFPSWAVHQYVQDPDLLAFMQKTKKQLVEELDRSMEYDGSITEAATLDVVKERYLDITLAPGLGRHRPAEDAIFIIIPKMKDDSFSQIQLLISSARNSGFKGDIVLHIPSHRTMEKKIVDFLNGQTNIVVYEGLFDSLKDNKAASLLQNSPSADQTERDIKVVAFDIYLLWSQQYDPTSYVMILDGEDVSFFQSNPFLRKSCDKFEIHFYSEHIKQKLFSNMVSKDDFISDRMAHVLTMKGLEQLKNEMVIIPHALFGHVEIIQSVFREMLDGFDKYSCYSSGCDWAIINYLWYGSASFFGKGINYRMEMHNQGAHLIHPMFTTDHNFLVSKGLYDDKLKVFKNWDGSISPVVMRYYPFDVKLSEQ